MVILTDQNSLVRCLIKSNPHEVYNLDGMSFVGESWNTPEQTGDVTGLGVLRMLEAIESMVKILSFIKHQLLNSMVEWLRIQQGKPHHFIQDHLMVLLNYMDIGLQKTTESLMICLMSSGILFNHESER